MAYRSSILNFITDALSRSREEDKKESIADLIGDLTLTPSEAVRELRKRAGDKELRRRVEEYLGNDIPEYFKDGPVLYLARHLASPNFETMRLAHLTEPLGMKTVVSQDTKDMFVSRNHEKRALAKLSVCKKISRNTNGFHEQFQNIAIVDFNAAEGKPLCSIETLWGEGLADFHSEIFKRFTNGRIENPDDAAWIDRHHRGNILEHFKHLLPLFLAHGIFFEDYVSQDTHFVKHTLLPAFHFVEKRFGYRPIIARLTPGSMESDLFWLSYPTEVLNIICDRMKKREGMLNKQQ